MIVQYRIISSLFDVSDFVVQSTGYHILDFLQEILLDRFEFRNGKKQMEYNVESNWVESMLEPSSQSNFDSASFLFYLLKAFSYLHIFFRWS
jgi:hypothetical protein